MNYLEACKSRESAIKAFGKNVIGVAESLNPDLWKLNFTDRLAKLSSVYYNMETIEEDRQRLIPDWYE